MNKILSCFFLILCSCAQVDYVRVKVCPGKLFGKWQREEPIDKLNFDLKNELILKKARKVTFVSYAKDNTCESATAWFERF